MNRRAFITSALKAGAAGLLIPEWLGYKGRSQVAVPGLVQEPRFDEELMQLALDLAGFNNVDMSEAIMLIHRATGHRPNRLYVGRALHRHIIEPRTGIHDFKREYLLDFEPPSRLP